MPPPAFVVVVGLPWTRSARSVTTSAKTRPIDPKKAKIFGSFLRSASDDDSLQLVCSSRRLRLFAVVKNTRFVWCCHLVLSFHQHQTAMSSIEEQAAEAIPAEVHMISGCKDEQTSADVSNVASFSLPDPAGRAGGALTSAMLKTLYQDHQKPDDDLSFQDVLLSIRDILSDSNFTQIPQLTSSRPLDISSPFEIVPDGNEGTKRAVIIGINYVGQQGELRGCQNDANNMAEYIQDVWGFEEDNIVFLMDDGEHDDPTKENIVNAFRQLVNDSQEGDVAFVHYSGHGGKVRDDDGDEKDGYDETLIPLDYQSAGQIRDDDLFTTLVGAMPKGVQLTCVMDCCHSGTVLDLPFQFVADGEHEGMEAVEDFQFGPLLSLAQQIFGGDSVKLVQGLMGAALNRRFG